MKTQLQDDLDSTKKVSSFAKRSYKIYQEHYLARNLKPALTLDEFMENYR
ncbi:hypothetical protein [Lutimonas vermicola]|uniref:Uncharacterized protein n=1 Tax=Lutimonas vermicola TaxID=414288 RepID=A0ABU9KXG0_9FLAO